MNGARVDAPDAAAAATPQGRASRRLILAGLALTGPSALLAACGTSATTSAPASTAQTGAAKSAAPVTIGWDTFRGVAGGFGTRWPDDMVKTFQDKNPSIKVEYRPIALDNG